MIATIASLFGASLFFILYTYFFYPVVLFVFVRLKGKTFNNTSSENLPKLTLLISAFNEKDSIEKKIKNSMELNYPIEQLEILIVSDASDDGTDEIVKRFAPQVKLIRSETRQGKNGCLNLAVPQATADIIVFSDADCLFEKESLKALACFFHDSKVGGVTGKLSVAGKTQEGLYRRYEEKVREWEGALGQCINATGTIFAMRKSLFKDVAPEAANDFTSAMDVLAQGYHFCYTSKAIAYEGDTSSVDEFKRKVRTISRGLAAFKLKFKSLNLVTKLQVLSHKLLRWWVWMALILLLATNLTLIAFSKFYLVFLGLQIAFYFSAWLYKISPKTGRAFSICYYFLLVNYAAFKANIRFFSGKQNVMWQSPSSSRKS